MSHDHSSKDNSQAGAGQASGAGGGLDAGPGLAGGIPAGANSKGQAAHPAGVSPTFDSRTVLTSGPKACRVTFTYKNWCGEISVRLVHPLVLFFGNSQWHPEHQWLLVAYDLNKEAERTFAMKDISDWAPT